jgi:hypothetical protein
VALDLSRTLQQSGIRPGSTLQLKLKGLLAGMLTGPDADEISVVGESARPRIEVGKSYWYCDSQGVFELWKVVAIHHTVPPSYSIQTDDTTRTAVAMAPELLDQFPVPEGTEAPVADSPITDPQQHLARRLQHMHFAGQVMPPEEEPGGCCQLPTLRLNLYAYIEAFFRRRDTSMEHDGQVVHEDSVTTTESPELRARRFLDSKVAEMSVTSKPAEFCELSLAHELTSDIRPPYAKCCTNMAMIGTYPTAGPLMQCATFRHWLIKLGLVGYQVPIVDCIPY